MEFLKQAGLDLGAARLVRDLKPQPHPDGMARAFQCPSRVHPPKVSSLARVYNFDNSVYAPSAQPSALRSHACSRGRSYPRTKSPSRRDLACFPLRTGPDNEPWHRGRRTVMPTKSTHATRMGRRAAGAFAGARGDLGARGNPRLLAHRRGLLIPPKHGVGPIEPRVQASFYNTPDIFSILYACPPL